MTDKKTGGLAGVVAGETSISTVGKEGMGLTYRGYSINDLAERATFEEVAYLLLYGHLPKQSELDAYKQKLKSLRGLPLALRTILEQLPGCIGSDDPPWSYLFYGADESSRQFLATEIEPSGVVVWGRLEPRQWQEWDGIFCRLVDLAALPRFPA